MKIYINNTNLGNL